MMLDQSLRAVADGLKWSDGRCIPVASGRWYGLFHARARPVLMSAAMPQYHRAGLRFFAGSGAKTIYGRTLLGLNALVPLGALAPGLLAECSMDAQLSGKSLVADAMVTAIQIGTPGPYQKACALLMSERGEGVALAKVAMSESADEMVNLEAAWLRTIADTGLLNGQVPRVLAAGKALNGRSFLVTTLAPTSRVTRSFTAAHLRFLEALAQARPRNLKFAASPCNQLLERSLAELEPHLARNRVRVLESALWECQHSLAGWSGPFVIAQGDFAPWNIRMQRDRIFVFDWEYANADANPLFDALNYFVIPRAVSGSALTPRFFASAMRRAQHIARALHRAEKWRVDVISALSLAYLLQVLLFYARSRMRLDPGDPVMRGVWGLLEQRAAWMVSA